MKAKNQWDFILNPVRATHYRSTKIKCWGMCRKQEVSKNASDSVNWNEYFVKPHDNVYYSWKCIYTMTWQFHFWVYVLEYSRVQTVQMTALFVRRKKIFKFSSIGKWKNQLFIQDIIQQSEWNILMYMDGFHNT